jgi:hypothetical protein
MRMAPIAMSFGFLLTILGIVLISLADTKSLTALIPSYVGIALILLGMLARSEKLRMHAMHVAALLGLVGLIGGLVMGILGLVRDRPATVWGGSLAMAALCGAFLALCVRSFIAARRARKMREGA